MSQLHRRQLLQNLSAAGAMAALAPDSLLAADRDRIRAENEHEGTTDWQLTYTRIDPKTKCTRFGGGLGGRSTRIEGFASHTSIRTGEKIDFFVSTDPPTPFVIDLYRLGYYQGKGGRHMQRLGPFRGKPQPTPPVGDQRLRECRWEPCIRFEIPRQWVSGVYLGKLSATKHRYQSYLIFIVRDDRACDFLFQCSDNTWQAYNAWPDNYSLYINDREDGKILVSGVKVSFDRPYGKYTQILDNPLSQGSGEYLLWEFPLAFWMERHGYDASYCSNVDVHSDPKCLTRAKAFLSVGHDEYWSREQYDRVMAAVKAGVNVAFLSGNTCCFVAPYSASSGSVDHRILTRAGRYGGIRPKEKPFMADLSIEAPNEATLIGADRLAVQRLRRLDRHQAGSLDLRRHEDEEGRAHRRSGGLGVSRRTCGHSRSGSRRRGTDVDGRRRRIALHGDDLSGTEGQSRLQRFDDLLGAGTIGTPGPHAPHLAPRSAAWSR